MANLQLWAEVFIVWLFGVGCARASWEEDPEVVYRRSQLRPRAEDNNNFHENLINEMYRSMITMTENLIRLSDRVAENSGEMKTLETAVERLGAKIDYNYRTSLTALSNCRSGLTPSENTPDVYVLPTTSPISAGHYNTGQRDAYRGNYYPNGLKHPEGSMDNNIHNTQSKDSNQVDTSDDNLDAGEENSQKNADNNSDHEESSTSHQGNVHHSLMGHPQSVDTGDSVQGASGTSHQEDTTSSQNDSHNSLQGDGIISQTGNTRNSINASESAPHHEGETTPHDEGETISNQENVHNFPRGFGANSQHVETENPRQDVLQEGTSNSQHL